MRWTRRPFVRALPSALVLALLLGCDSEPATMPSTDFADEPLMSHTSDTPDVSGSYSIPVPPENTGNSAYVAWHSTGIQVPGGATVRIRVVGGISVSAHPIYVSVYCSDPGCTPYAGQTIGPTGTDYWQLLVSVRLNTGSGILPVALQPVQGEEYTVEGYLTAPSAGGVIEVERRGINGGGSCMFGRPPGYTGPGPCYGGTDYHHVGAYMLSGTQTLSVEAVRPFEVHANRTRIAPGDTVRFTIDTDVPLGSPRYRYVPGDTLPEPSNNAPAPYSCWSQLECTAPITASGRMYAVATVGGQTLVRPSQIVWVGERAVLELECEPAELPAGNTTTCTATTDPEESETEILGWSWTPSAPGDSASPRTEACTHTEPVCTVPVYESGTMTVRARVGGVEQEASDDVAVTSKKLVVEITPGEAVVEPVLDRTFDAVAQTWADAGTPPRTYDVVELEVRAYWQPSGRPAAGANLEFVAEPEDGSGGHLHGSRPTGSFFRTEDRPTAADQKKGVVRARLELTAGDDGRARIVYRGSGVSGIEVVRVKATAEGQEAEDSATVVVKLPDEALVPVDRTGQHYVFEGQANSHFDVENYLAPGVIEHMERIWGDYVEKHRLDPRRYPLDTERFVVTGASVLWGGLYDINRNWRTPHSTHRIGRDVDFNADILESRSNRVIMERHCSRYVFEGVATTCEVHNGNHFHVFVGRTHYHR